MMRMKQVTDIELFNDSLIFLYLLKIVYLFSDILVKYLKKTFAICSNIVPRSIEVKCDIYVRKTTVDDPSADLVGISVKKCLDPKKCFSIITQQ